MPVLEPTYWNENIQVHFIPLVALWLFAFTGALVASSSRLTAVVAVILRLFERESLEFEERVYEWAIFGLTFISSICTSKQRHLVLTAQISAAWVCFCSTLA